MSLNWQYRILALMLAIFCWYLVTGREKVDTLVRLRLEMTGMPEGLMIKSGLRDQLEVTIRGPKGMAKKLNDEGGLSYSLNLRRVVPGINVIALDPENISLPKVMEVVEIRPSRLELAVEKRLTKVVSVELVFKNLPASKQKFLEKWTTPQSVQITGPESAVKDITQVRTQPIALPGELPVFWEGVSDLSLPEAVDSSPVTVKVYLSYETKAQQVWVNVPVKVSGPAKGRASVNPATVELKIKAPLAVVREADLRESLEAYLELSPDVAPGKYDIGYRVRMPQGCELLEANPDKVSVTVK